MDTKCIVSVFKFTVRNLAKQHVRWIWIWKLAFWGFVTWRIQWKCFWKVLTSFSQRFFTFHFLFFTFHFFTFSKWKTSQNFSRTLSWNLPSQRTVGCQFLHLNCLCMIVRLVSKHYVDCRWIPHFLQVLFMSMRYNFWEYFTSKNWHPRVFRDGEFCENIFEKFWQVFHLENVEKWKVKNRKWKVKNHCEKHVKSFQKHFHWIFHVTKP